MVAFAKGLIEVGQGLPVTRTVNIMQALPSTSTVCYGIVRLAQKKRDKFATKLDDIMMLGGRITCDGMKNKLTGDKFYDLVLHYIAVRKHLFFPTIGSGKLYCKVLFVNCNNGEEDANSIRMMLNEKLQASAGIYLDHVYQNFKFVTDCATMMAKVFNAYVSQLFLLSERSG